MFLAKPRSTIFRKNYFVENSHNASQYFFDLTKFLYLINKNTIFKLKKVLPSGLTEDNLTNNESEKEKLEKECFSPNVVLTKLFIFIFQEHFKWIS